MRTSKANKSLFGTRERQIASSHSSHTPALVAQEGQPLAARASGSPSIPAAFASAAHPRTPPRFSCAALTPPAKRGSTALRGFLITSRTQDCLEPHSLFSALSPMPRGHKLRLMSRTSSGTLWWYWNQLLEQHVSRVGNRLVPTVFTSQALKICFHYQISESLRNTCFGVIPYSWAFLLLRPLLVRSWCSDCCDSGWITTADIWWRSS